MTESTRAPPDQEVQTMLNDIVTKLQKEHGFDGLFLMVLRHNEELGVVTTASAAMWPENGEPSLATALRTAAQDDDESNFVDVEEQQTH